MVYIIPAWYKNNSWFENEQIWYEPKARSEFDDSVKQLQLFHRKKIAAYRLLLLSFAPNFRHFLHRKGVLRANCWSVFDAILDIGRTKMSLFSTNDINWPQGSEFVRSPFLTVVFLNKKKYAEIYYGDYGNLIMIDLYENDVIVRKNLYDDRGFVASSIVYSNGVEQYQDYLRENAAWKLRESAVDGHVDINPKYMEYHIRNGATDIVCTFANTRYDSLGQVIEEVLQAYLESTEEDDVFFAAAHAFHNGILSRQLEGRRVMTSFFENRFQIEDNAADEDIRRLLAMSGSVVGDSEVTVNRLKNCFGDVISEILDISPYETRMETGISQQFATHKLCLPIDDMEQKLLTGLISALAEYLPSHKDVEVHLMTRYANMINNDCLQELTEEVRQRFFIDAAVDEQSVSRLLREQRLVLELRNPPDNFLQILTVSMGIPQIVVCETPLAKNRKNALLIDDISGLSRALDYYLDGFENRNSASVCAFEMARKFSGDVICKKWENVLARV